MADTVEKLCTNPAPTNAEITLLRPPYRCLTWRGTDRETGKGWEGCKDYCRADATFSAQAGALAEINMLEGYCDWMRDFFTPVPDAHYELKFFGADESRSTVTAVAVFHGTQTGPGGPVPATGNTVAADYAASQ